MQSEEVKTMIQAQIPGARVEVDGEGCSFSVLVISEQFEGLSLLKKQQAVMSVFSEKLASGELHALTVKAYTPGQWQGLQ